MSLARFLPGLRWVVLVVVVSATLIAALWFNAYYRSLVSSRQQNAIDNAFDSLAMASDQLEARLDAWRSAVAQGAEANRDDPKNFATYVQQLVLGFSPCSQAPNLTSQPAAAHITSTDIDINVEPLSAERHAMRFRALATGFCAESRFEELLTSIFEDMPEETFDDILVIESDGSVLTQLKRFGPRVVRMNSIVGKLVPAGIERMAPLAQPTITGASPSEANEFLAALRRTLSPGPPRSPCSQDLRAFRTVKLEERAISYYYSPEPCWVPHEARTRNDSLLLA